jgi:hypothetical protein
LVNVLLRVESPLIKELPAVSPEAKADNVSSCSIWETDEGEESIYKVIDPSSNPCGAFERYPQQKLLSG